MTLFTALSKRQTHIFEKGRTLFHVCDPPSKRAGGLEDHYLKGPQDPTFWGHVEKNQPCFRYQTIPTFVSKLGTTKYVWFPFARSLNQSRKVIQQFPLGHSRDEISGGRCRRLMGKVCNRFSSVAPSCAGEIPRTYNVYADKPAASNPRSPAKGCALVGLNNNKVFTNPNFGLRLQ